MHTNSNVEEENELPIHETPPLSLTVTVLKEIVFVSPCGTATIEALSFPNDVLEPAVKYITDNQQLLLYVPFPCFQKECIMPRKQAFFSNNVPNYPFSRTFIPANLLPTVLAHLLHTANTLFNDATFNAILINQYENGKEYINHHSDSLGVSPEHGVVTISYGATRRLDIKNKLTKKTVAQIPLLSGIAYRMTGTFQSLYTHGIPKQLRVKHSRMSFTLRQHTHSS